MAVRKRGQLPADLSRARDRFKEWRRSKTRGRRIPASLWSLAVGLVDAHGLHRTASVLKLDYYSLKKHVEQQSFSRESDNTFVEVVADPLAGGGECVVELQDASGASMRVTLRGQAPPDLAELARDFWGVR